MLARLVSGCLCELQYLTSNSSPGVAEVRLGKWTVEEGSVEDMVGFVVIVDYEGI